MDLVRIQKHDDNEDDCYHLTKCNNSCVNPWEDPTTSKMLVNLYIWLNGVSLCVISLLGVFGNVATIYIFSKKSMRSTFHAHLSVLALFDLLFLLIRGTSEIMKLAEVSGNYTIYPHPDSHPSKAWAFLYSYFLWPMVQVFMTASTYMTVLIAVDRFLAIRYPFRATRRDSFVNNCNACTVDKKRVVTYSISVFAFSLVYCIPYFLEYEPRGHGVHWNIYWTDLRSSETYTTFFTIYVDLFVRLVIPFAVLFLTNFILYRDIRRHLIPCHRERRVLITLFAVVIIFMICQTGRVFTNISTSLLHETLECCQQIDPGLGSPVWDHVASMITKILLAANSSFNFFIYVWFTPNFWSTLSGRPSNTPNHTSNLVSLPIIKITSPQI